MTRVYEAEREDGTRKLVAPSVINSIFADAAKYAPSRKFSMTGKMLANFMFCSGFVRLVCIDYNCSEQKRTEIIRRKAA